MRGLGAVHREQRGDREEEREAQAGQGVAVDGGAAAVARRHEAGVGDGLAQVLGVGGGGLEVQQAHRLPVRADHDVVHVQVVEDHAAGVDGGDRLLDAGVDTQRPPGVVGDRDRVGVGREQRMPVAELAVERLAFEELHHQEAVVAEHEPVAYLGSDTESRQPQQRVPFAFEPGDGVGAVGGEPGVRAAFLEHDLLAVAGVGAEVDAAAVGEVQRRLDPVGQVADGGAVACVQVRTEEFRQRHPVGDVEGGRPAVGYEPAGRVLDGGDQAAALAHAEALHESAVADVERSFPQRRSVRM